MKTMDKFATSETTRPRNRNMIFSNEANDSRISLQAKAP